MKKNDFVKFPGGFGIVAEISSKTVNVVLHNGIKITNGWWPKTALKVISRHDFFALVKKKGQTLWHSSEDSLKAFHGVTLQARRNFIDVAQKPVEQPIVDFINESIKKGTLVARLGEDNEIILSNGQSDNCGVDIRLQKSGQWHVNDWQ